MPRRELRHVSALALLLAVGCGGSIDEMKPSGPETPGVRPPGSSGGSGSTTGGAGTVQVGVDPSNPFATCEAALPLEPVRLSDRHLANGVRDLLGLAAPPRIETAVGGDHGFLANKAAALNGSVALSLRDAIEGAAAEATVAGSPLVACAETEEACARGFIERFATRSFRRPLEEIEKNDLFAVYQAGRANADHAAGIRLVIEATLQAPSFLYHGTIGAPEGKGVDRASEHELATTISLFLRDSLPDEATWKAVEEGRFATPAGVSAEVDRLLATPEVKANLSRMLVRLFELDRIHDVEKSAPYELPDALAASMHEESRRFLEDALWTSGKLGDLLTSRKGFVDKGLAAVYGVQAPSSGTAEVMLPAAQRAGILTHASLLTIEAAPDESSVVHRGNFVARQLLCIQSPPPVPEDVALGEEIKKAAPTERERAARRLEMPRCGACHGTFDPLGITFEHYDTLGKFRTTIKTPGGDVPVDASWTPEIADLGGEIKDAVDLSSRLASSKAVRACVARQFASYALGRHIPAERGCATGDLARKLDASGGDLLELVRAVTAWDGLRLRKEGGNP